MLRDIAQIEVAMGDQSVALIFRNLKPLVPSDEEKLIAFAKAHAVQIYMQPEGIDSVYLLAPQTTQDLSYELPQLGIKIFSTH